MNRRRSNAKKGVVHYCRRSCRENLLVPGYCNAEQIDRQSVFFGAAADTKCATFPTTPRLADLDSSTGGQQGRLLQLGPSRSTWTSARPTAVSPERRCSVDLRSEEERTHNSIAPRTPLAQSS